jgi:hypothetical protein
MGGPRTPVVHMSRRAEFQQLRGSDPTRLEIQVQDLLRRPVGQIAPTNLMDLFALAEYPTPPSTIQDALAKFVVRAKKEVADLPSGPSWNAFVKEIAEIDASQVPNGFRDLIVEQKTHDDRDSEPLEALLDAWTPVTPTAFEMGEDEPAIEHAKTAKTPKKKTTTRRGSLGAGRARPSAVTDENRVRLISELCMERLANASDSGLKELVLVAGVRHRAKANYPNVTPNEVTTVLKGLKASGRVRYSAGRWSSVARW